MSRTRILAYLVLCFLLVFAGTPLCFASGIDAANAGIQAYKKGDKTKAKALFENALKSNELSKENYVIVNNQLCEVLRSESKNQEAVDCYSETLYLSPDNPAALLGRGGLYHQMRQYENAVEDLTRYTALSPKNPKGYIDRGLVFRVLKKYDRAISDLSHAVRLRPGNGDAYIHRGGAYFEAGNYHIALADFKKAVKIDPENPYACQAMAWFYAACPNTDLRDGEKAVELAEKALKLEHSDTPDPVFPATLAAAYAESGMYGKAADTQKQAMARVKGSWASFDIPEEEFHRRLKLYEHGEAYRAF